MYLSYCVLSRLPGSRLPRTELWRQSCSRPWVHVISSAWQLGRTSSTARLGTRLKLFPPVAACASRPHLHHVRMPAPTCGHCTLPPKLTRGDMGKKLAEVVRAKRRPNAEGKASNPFEVHVNRKKHDVLGQRSRSGKGLPGVARSKSIMKVSCVNWLATARQVY